MDKMTWLALKQKQQPKVLEKWVAKSGGIIMYEAATPSLVWHFIKMHSLKIKPTPQYK